MTLYDDISEVYHLVYADWERSIGIQAEALDAVLATRLGPGPHAVRDVSCGIGTQSLGLASLGHCITASDLSTRAIARAEREAASRGLDIRFAVADMRSSDPAHEGRFGAVLCADNSLPHLEDDAEILAAFAAFKRTLRPGGALVLSVRDYAREERRPSDFRPVGVRETERGRVTVFQVWDWDPDGVRYDFRMYFVREPRGAPPLTLVSRGRYYAVTTDKICKLLERAGFVDVERIDGAFFQPVLVATQERS